jgi:putative endonuclease
MLFYVYVIRSDEGYQYSGETSDLDRRLREHNNKELSFWTKRGSNWQLIYFEQHENREEARKREKWLKSGIGREWLKSKFSE